ncbi:MAG: GNAT family N-acetyltransferase [Tannerellaceae bacterium]|nr:GNAT family N-acetyltransferase [Tannerellaceae bacterium]
MEKKIEWKISRFEQLTIDQLYELLYLRCRIFIVEQNCAYLDVDCKDQKAYHVCGYYDGRMVAYCRLFKPGDYFEEASIGRVVVDERYRSYGFGKELMQAAIDAVKKELGENTIVISAQLYLKRFYESLGFIQISEEYLEDDIPHIRMRLM